MEAAKSEFVRNPILDKIKEGEQNPVEFGILNGTEYGVLKSYRFLLHCVTWVKILLYFFVMQSCFMKVKFAKLY